MFVFVCAYVEIEEEEKRERKEVIEKTGEE